MADQPNAYPKSFEDGRKSMFNEIVSTLTGEQHPAECRCEPCLVMRVVMEQYLGTMQEMLGDEVYHDLANNLAVAAGQEPRPFRK